MKYVKCIHIDTKKRLTHASCPKMLMLCPMQFEACGLISKSSGAEFIASQINECTPARFIRLRMHVGNAAGLCRILPHFLCMLILSRTLLITAFQSCLPSMLLPRSDKRARGRVTVQAARELRVGAGELVRDGAHTVRT